MTTFRHAAPLLLAVGLAAPAHAQPQQVKPPIATYGVDVGTRMTTIPGMPAGGMGAMAGMMMPAGVGAPQKELWLGLRSSQRAAGIPEAQHTIPPGMAMGAALPLVGRAPTRPGQVEDDDETAPEKPKARMLVYWGCGETIRPGQPKIADTEKMSLAEFGQALAGRSPPERWSAQRNAQLVWPNEREKTPVPANARLGGEQLVRGNATPDIKFTIGDRQDFMAPMEITATGAIEGPVALSWKPIATAQGYFIQAMGFRQNQGEMIIWTSSELQDTGWGLMTWLPNDFRQRMIGEKVIFGPAVTSCTIPRGIFTGVEGAMVNGIAYGEELNLAHPPRPADPKVAWEPVWAVKLRVKSVGMTPLGMDSGGDRGEARRSDDRAPPGAAAPAAAPKPANPADDAAEALKGLRKLLPF